MDSSPIRNTAEFDSVDAMLALAVSMGPDGPSGFIEEQERAGQSQLVNSDRLPVDAGEDGDYLALGFTFGKPDPSDPLFRPATLPPGWSRRATDHAMGSEIIDQHGRARVSIFYKAAFYDRKASMYVISHSGYLSKALFYGTPVVLDDEWLPLATAQSELDAIAQRNDNAASDADARATTHESDFWVKRAAELRMESAKARALSESLS